LWVRGSTYAFGAQTAFFKLFQSADLPIRRDTTNDNSTVDTTLWNDKTKTGYTALVTMTTGYWAKALLCITTSGQVYYVYPEAEFATEDLAKKGALPYADTLRIDDNAFLATIVFQNGDATIANRFYDIRPYFPRAFGSEVITAGGVVVDHGSLTGLGDDDHGHYYNSTRLESWFDTKTQDDLLDGTIYKQYSEVEKIKLSGIVSGANVNVQADWFQTNVSDDSYIKNKPSIPSGITPATTVVSETSYSQAPVVGIAISYAREDHSHGTPAAGGGGITEAQCYAIACSVSLGGF
jgi:hypothetical protein